MPEVTTPTINTGDAAAKDKAPPGNASSTTNAQLDTPSTASNSNIENGVSSTSPDKKTPEKSEAEILLAQGKRHLYVRDFPNAVATLGDACAKLSQMYGDVADECADAYFSYGRALLELAREESTGLDPNALGTGSDKDESEDDEEENEDEDDEKTKEDVNEETKKDDNEKTEKDDNEKTKEDDQAEETKTSSAGANVDTTIDKTIEDEGNAESDEVDNLQLAWEVLELAKNIYERQKQDAKLAETYLYLGEVALESESYANAVDDMKHCVEIQKKINAPDREIAETYFQLGIACSLSNEFDEAIENFKSSSEILNKRIQYLKDGGAPSEDAAKNPFYSVEKEISEIQEILPEIQAKITDMEDSKLNTIKSVIAAVQNKFSDGAGSSSGSSSGSSQVANGSTPKPATDISHLVRKKRKPEDEPSSDASSLKKTCTSEVKK